jgi:hypothetical protein
MSENGQPNYARPENGRQIIKKDFVLDNRWVVPYSPYLLKRYNCHINVEMVHDIQSVKYLYKYVYKGPDRAHAKLVDKVRDEVKYWIDGRYISAIEGCWKILRFLNQEKSHTIMPLPIHLEGEQTVYWEEGWDEDKIKEAMDKKKMLQAFFDLNNRKSNNYDPEASKYLYYEIPEHYKWEPSKGSWIRRKKNIDVLFGLKNPSFSLIS